MFLEVFSNFNGSVCRHPWGHSQIFWPTLAALLVHTNTACEADRQISHHFLKHLKLPDLFQFWKQRRNFYFIATKTTKQLVTPANCGNLGLLWCYWRLIPFQLIGSSQAGTLFLHRYAQMSSALTTQLYAHFWTWDEQKSFKYGTANKLHVHTGMHPYRGCRK